jgi:hypothetical protein
MTFQRAAAATWVIECLAASLRGENECNWQLEWAGRLLDTCGGARHDPLSTEKNKIILIGCRAPTPHNFPQAPPSPDSCFSSPDGPSQSQNILRVIQ